MTNSERMALLDRVAHILADEGATPMDAAQIAANLAGEVEAVLAYRASGSKLSETAWHRAQMMLEGVK